MNNKNKTIAILLSSSSAETDKTGKEIVSLAPPVTKGLGNLPIVFVKHEYLRGNSGFLNTFQLIDVPAFQGKGEFCPTMHFYQNLGEAEYICAVYQYMRLLGYPAEKISIITTYNGQKHLIRDVINQRCKSGIFGRPAIITTG